MDIQHLVDRLEELIDEGRHMPFSRFTMIDEERALEIIDQMRISIPEEIEKSSKVLAQRDRVLAQANEEAARIMQQAREKGDAMLDQDVNVQAAQNRAANIVEEARQEAERIRAEADSYVADVLSELEQTLTRNLNTVRNGINAVQQDDGEQAASSTGYVTGQEAQNSFPAVNEREEVDVDANASYQQRSNPTISIRRDNTSE